MSATQFEDDFKGSVSKDMIIIKNRDVFLPPVCRTCNVANIHLPAGLWDFTVYKYPILILLELKSTQSKSFSFDEKIIKAHQIKSLIKYKDYNGISSGFVFNFAKYDNLTYFLDIKDYVNFTEATDRKSIPLDYIEQKGVKILNQQKKVHYKYDIEGLFKMLTKGV